MITALQKLVLTWAAHAFGDVAYDPKERALRVLEEAAELAQEAGVQQSQAIAVLDRTYSRPKGDAAQEAAGVLVTLLSYCASRDIDLGAAFVAEVVRVTDPTKLESLRKKHAAKVAAGTSARNVEQVAQTILIAQDTMAGIRKERACDCDEPVYTERDICQTCFGKVSLR